MNGVRWESGSENMSDVVLKPAPKPFTIHATHTGSTSEIAITGMTIDGVSGTLGYYTIKQGFKGKVYEFDVASEEEALAYLEVSKNLSTTPLKWLKLKAFKVASKGHIGRSWRYPVIVEAYDYDAGLRVTFQQTTGGRIDVSMHGEASPLG